MEPALVDAGPRTYGNRLNAEIRACMARKQMKQSDLANAIGLSRSTLQNKLAGRVDFTVGELDSIAHQFGLTVSELLYRVEVSA